MNLKPRHQTLITCSPGEAYFGIQNPKDHNIATLADPEKATAQHQVLREIIQQTGSRVINLPELPGHPNSVFTKDTAVCTPNGYIRLRMGLPSRRGEDQWVADILDHYGIADAGTVVPPATVEGGDIIVGEKIVFIGHSSRTNEAGVIQIGDFFIKMGYEIRTTEVPPPFLHLGGAMTLLSADTVLCVAGIIPDPFFDGFHRIEIPNEGFISGNVITLPGRNIIADQANKPAIEALRHHEFVVWPIDLSEFIKGSGGPSCLILEVSGL